MAIITCCLCVLPYQALSLCAINCLSILTPYTLYCPVMHDVLQIYSDELPFEQTATDYRCPQCNAPKRRFARFNVETGKVGCGQSVVGGRVGGLQWVRWLAATGAAAARRKPGQVKAGQRQEVHSQGRAGARHVLSKRVLERVPKRVLTHGGMSS